VCYDRLLLTVGSVAKLLPVPGVAEHALGFRSVGEALALRDHLVRQVELAAAAAAGGRVRPQDGAGGIRFAATHQRRRKTAVWYRNGSRAPVHGGQVDCGDAPAPLPLEVLGSYGFAR
jgi:NADH dehydrogenase FAD-containing subunit